MGVRRRVAPTPRPTPRELYQTTLHRLLPSSADSETLANRVRRGVECYSRLTPLEFSGSELHANVTACSPLAVLLEARPSPSCRSRPTRVRKSCCASDDPTARRQQEARVRFLARGAAGPPRRPRARVPRRELHPAQPERRDGPRGVHGVLRPVPAASRSKRRSTTSSASSPRATSSCWLCAASCPTSRARVRPTRRRGSTCSASPTARSSSTGTTARRNEPREPGRCGCARSIPALDSAGFRRH